MLEGEFKNAIVTEVGAWEMGEGKDKQSYPYVGIFNGRENLQIAIDKDCEPPADLAFGDRITLWCRINQAAKVAGDRSFGVIKLRAINIERVKAAGVKPLPAAAAA